MKYLNALLREAENSPHTHSQVPTKPTKPVLSVLSGDDCRNVGEKSASKDRKCRPFLPRPLGQEDAVDPFIVWEGLFNWLIAHHPEHFTAIREAEDAICALEAQGVTNGTDYEAACHELLRRFERARRLKLSQGFKIWMQ